MFSREFCEILKSTFSPRTPRVISWNFIKTWLATCFYKSIHFFQQNLHLTDQHAKGESYLKSRITTFTKSQTMIWVNIFKNGPSKICGQPLKISSDMVCFHLKYFEDCLPHILLGPFFTWPIYDSYESC